MTRHKHNKIDKKKISKDCWDLDFAFLKWLRIRLPIYLKEGGKFVDFTYYKFNYNGIEYTQEDIIKRMIQLLNETEPLDAWDEDYMPKVNEILDLWKLVFYTMWW